MCGDANSTRLWKLTINVGDEASERISKQVFLIMPMLLKILQIPAAPWYKSRRVFHKDF